MNHDNWGNHGAFMKALVDGLATPRMSKSERNATTLALLLLVLLFLL